MRKKLAHPYLLLVLASLFWSGNVVIGRAIRDDIPPFALAYWRWVIVFALALPFALPHLRKEWPLLKKSWLSVLLLGLLGVASYNTLVYIALQYTAATNALLINSFIPIATIALSSIFLGKHLRCVEGIGVLVSLIGVLNIVAQGNFASLFALILNIGDLWMLAAVLTWALYTIGLQWRPAGVHPMLILTALVGVGIIALTPIYAWEISQNTAHGRQLNLSPALIASIAYIGIFPGFLGYVFYNRGVADVGASKASLFIHLMPVFGSLLSALFLAEIPKTYHLIGMGLIFTGIYLTTARKA